MRARILAGGVAVVLATGVLSPPAFAQSASDKAAAEGLFDQGRSAMQEGDFAKACGLLERSQHIEHAVGTLLYLAECYEKSGRTASAWATFREAADAAKDPARTRTGRDRAQRLEPLLSRLTIQVAPETQQLPNLTVDQRDKAVQPALFNVPVPTDPGEYKVTASAPGYETWSGIVTVPDQAGRVSISIPALRKGAEPDKAASNAAMPASATPLSGSPSTSDDTFRGSGQVANSSAESPYSGQRMLGLIVGGVGVVGMGVGSVFGLQAIAKYSDAKNHCPRGLDCDDGQGPALADEARSAATVSTILFGIGGAALIGGAVLYFTAPNPSTAASRDGLRATFGPNGITLKGSFQ